MLFTAALHTYFAVSGTWGGGLRHAAARRFAHDGLTPLNALLSARLPPASLCCTLLGLDSQPPPAPAPLADVSDASVVDLKGCTYHDNLSGARAVDRGEAVTFPGEVGGGVGRRRQGQGVGREPGKLLAARREGGREGGRGAGGGGVPLSAFRITDAGRAPPPSRPQIDPPTCQLARTPPQPPTALPCLWHVRRWIACTWVPPTPSNCLMPGATAC